MARGNALDLNDDKTTGVFRSHRHRQIVQRQSFPFHGDVAGGIRRRAAQQCDIDGKCLVAQPLFPIDLQELDEVFGRGLVQLAAFEPRIHKGAQAYPGDGSGAVRGNAAI